VKPLLLMIALALATPALADDLHDDFSRANSVFEASVSLLGKNDSSATEGLRQSAAMYESIAEEHDIENSALLTNAANARLLAGQTGRAIALYHRALRINPADDNARTNLAVARTRAQADIAIDRSTGVVELLTSWRRALPAHTRAIITISAWTALWLWAALRVVGVRAGTPMRIALPLACVACAGGLTLAADTLSASTKPVGVVVANESIGRTGPDAAVYDPSFTKPLPEGVEFVVIDQRAGWVLGRLGDGRETWLRTSDIELVGA